MTVTRGQPVAVGIHLTAGLRDYRVVKLLLSVRPFLGELQLDHPPSPHEAKNYFASDLRAGDRDVTLAFDGRASAGNQLPAGTYVAGMEVAFEIDPKVSACEPGNQLVYLETGQDWLATLQLTD